jgi:hypothetical protein
MKPLLDLKNLPNYAAAVQAAAVQANQNLVEAAEYKGLQDRRS